MRLSEYKTHYCQHDRQQGQQENYTEKFFTHPFMDPGL